MTEPQVISTADIQSELSRIWDSLQGTNKMRACLFNLIFYTEKGSRSGYIHTIAQKVIDRFPSRVIIISVDKELKSDYLKAKVSVMSVSKGECDIACDLIEIDVSVSQQERIPFVILPNIIPDLPVYLVWAENPIKENPISYQLEMFTTRMIFDSESTENLPQFAKALLYHKEHSECDIADLNWARLESWRDLMSTAFYAKERLEKLQNAKQVQIIYNCHETESFCHTKIQSIYLQGWLACQLGWEIDKIERDQDILHFSYHRGDFPIKVSVIPETQTHLSPGTIISVFVLSSDDMEFSFARNLSQPHQITMKVSTHESCEMPSQFLFAKGESGQSLVKEICRKGTSTHYIKVLEMITKMEGLTWC